ncbi:hypothetical protein ACW0US_17630 [Xanthomonas euvesicatoria]
MPSMTPELEAKPEDRGFYIHTTINTLRAGATSEDPKLCLAMAAYHAEVVGFHDDAYDNPFEGEEDLEALAECYDHGQAKRMIANGDDRELETLTKALCDARVERADSAPAPR